MVDTVLPVLTAAVIARACTAVVHGQADKTLGELGVGAQELVLVGDKVVRMDWCALYPLILGWVWG